MGSIRDGFVQPQLPPAGFRQVGGGKCHHAAGLQGMFTGSDALSNASLARVYRWLRPPEPIPDEKMTSPEGLFLTREETHSAWCNQLHTQSNFLDMVDDAHKKAIHLKVEQKILKAKAGRGHGTHDQPVTSDEVNDVLSGWDTSFACRPDLLPRSVFKCNFQPWRGVLWLVQLLCGPSCLAYRPQLWRGAALSVRYKSSNPRFHRSWRMIFVKVQLGLLQEGIAARRLKTDIFSYIRPCQSGYIKGVDDPQLVLHEMCSRAQHANRRIWYIMGDFIKAFPRVWRALMLDLLHTGPKVHDGMFELMASMLESDSVHIWLSGRSVVLVTQGIPEGGSLGPLCYNLLPDDLVRRLEAQGLGFGVDANIPAAWRSHTWAGDGVPDYGIVANLRAKLRAGVDLPPAGLLALWPDLEASASRALDLESSLRVPCLFHADDPSSSGRQRGHYRKPWMSWLLGLQRVVQLCT